MLTVLYTDEKVEKEEGEEEMEVKKEEVQEVADMTRRRK